ncbi:MAG: sodium:solute symporter [Paludibacteraceae bacterium]|nr:sodium:solute symporter [Paludibacteraceae bacterium]
MFLWIFLGYFLLLMLVSSLVSRRSGGEQGDAFFLGNRRSPWWIVSIGMVGASVSGVSFVSVPGMVRALDFTYMQTVLGFFFGYVVIAKVLLPLYYRLNLTSVYGYLGERFGRVSHRTGASFFLLSKLIGAAVRLYVVVFILQYLVFEQYGIPMWITAAGLVLMMWLYTYRTGMKTIVWTDTLQTVCMLAALILIVWQLIRLLGFGVDDLPAIVRRSGHARIFEFSDWHSRQYFWKQFLSGVFIPIVMTGLDQDMMQKNLSCRTLRESQRNMYVYGLAFIPVNLLLLVLGALLLVYAGQAGIALPDSGDQILPMMASAYLGHAVAVLFSLGIVAAALSSADSALTALTTSFVIDILHVDQSRERHAKRVRMISHAGITLVFLLIIILFGALNNTSAIDAVYTIVSYTYGPLLGLYAYGLLTHRAVRDRLVPFIAFMSPVLCYLLSLWSAHCWGYVFGYELLMLNGLLTFFGLWITSPHHAGRPKKAKTTC